jgi:hypothetical protein
MEVADDEVTFGGRGIVRGERSGARRQQRQERDAALCSAGECPAP